VHKVVTLLCLMVYFMEEPQEKDEVWCSSGTIETGLGKF
jgi:hypothetical protein